MITLMAWDSNDVCTTHFANVRVTENVGVDGGKSGSFLLMMEYFSGLLVITRFIIDIFSATSHFS